MLFIWNTVSFLFVKGLGGLGVLKTYPRAVGRRELRMKLKLILPVTACTQRPHSVPTASHDVPTASS